MNSFFDETHIFSEEMIDEPTHFVNFRTNKQKLQTAELFTVSC